MQGIIPTDEEEAETKEEAAADPGGEDKERRWSYGSPGSSWGSQVSECLSAAAARAASQGRGGVGEGTSLASPIPPPFSPTNAFHWTHHPDANWQTRPRVDCPDMQSRGSIWGPRVAEPAQDCKAYVTTLIKSLSLSVWQSPLSCIF